MSTQPRPASTDIAVIGMHCRVPGADGIEPFWSNLCRGIESITALSERDLLEAGVPAERRHDAGYVRAAGVLDNAERFDAHFFGYTPREAESVDPQQRLFLEAAWEAVERAGYAPGPEAGAVGVFAGCGRNLGAYLIHHLLPDRARMEAMGDFQATIASDKDYVATRVAYKLDLRGPAITVQTACSTSLVAVHLACQSLLSGECDMALAGGVTLCLPQRAGYLYREGMILSPDGHCRAFDARARGTVGGNGLGVVVLKRAADAIAEGDTINAVIRGSAINNDGAAKVGFTAPGVEGQAAVIAEALAIADVEPNSIGYVEAHGTGTELGDPVEIAALAEAFRARARGRPLEPGSIAVGSVKTNIGHLDAAAGVVGLIKACLAVERGWLPPSLYFEQPNPKIDFMNSPFRVNSELRQWKTDGAPRRAGVSSFGIGGTNAHIVIEQAPPSRPVPAVRDVHLLPISARTLGALAELSRRLADHLERNPELGLSDVAHTLARGRRCFEHRAAVVCRTRSEAQAGLRRVAAAPEAKRRVSGTRTVAFLFPGQGAQFAGMARGPYAETRFREELDRCAERLIPRLGLDVRELLLATGDDDAEERLQRTAVLQPALFAFEYALARQWVEWGVRPHAMLGHSIGEYAAACMAGVLSRDDALDLVTERGRLMQQLPPGAMLAVPLAESVLRPLLPPTVSLAAVNSSSQCVVSGDSDAIRALANDMAGRGVACRALRTSHAFHSAMVEDVTDAFAEKVAALPRHSPRIPYLSNATGTWISEADVRDPRSFARQLRETVRFDAGLRALLGQPNVVLIEVGPGGALSALARQHPERTPETLAVASLPRRRSAEDPDACLPEALAEVFRAGVVIDWAAYYASQKSRRVTLPTYPFERRSYWIDAPAQPSIPAGTPLPRDSDPADWTYLPSWRRTPLATRGPLSHLQRCLVFSTGDQPGEALARWLIAKGLDPTVVRPGQELRSSDREHWLDPAERSQVEELFLALARAERLPRMVVHLLNAGRAAASQRTDIAVRWGLHSLIEMARALTPHAEVSPLDVAVVSSGMQEVVGGDLHHPERALLLGPVRVIPQENPQLRLRSIDLDVVSGADAVERLVDELSTPSPAPVCALRGLYRWLPVYERQRLAEPDVPSRLKVGGVYMITGGLGGLGFTLAEHLAHLRAKLVLIGRTGLPGGARRGSGATTSQSDVDPVASLERLGAEVAVFAADVSDPERMRQVLEAASARFGPIDGVFHAAGIPDGALFTNRTREESERVLSAKVAGTLVLDRLLAGQELPPHWVLFSSLASVQGGVGQAAYCAANAFLDAFATARAARGTGQNASVVSIGWDAWRDVGMAAAAASVRAVDHPRFTHVEVSRGERRYITSIGPKSDWVLAEHRIGASAVMPGACMLEFARAAFEQHTGNAVAEIRDLLLTAVLGVEDGDAVVEVCTSLRPAGPGFAFEISSGAGDGKATVHARGAIAPLEDSPRQACDLAARIARCGAPVRADASGPRAPSFEGVRYGPRFQNLYDEWVGSEEAIARIVLAPEFAAETAEWPLHPALVDTATGFHSSHIALTDARLPLSYGRVRVYRALPPEVYAISWCRERDAAILRFDVSITDPAGLPIVEIEDYTLRRRRLDATPLTASDRVEEAGEAEVAAEHEGIAPADGILLLQRILGHDHPHVLVSRLDLAGPAAPPSGSLRRLLDRASRARVASHAHPRPPLASAYRAPEGPTERMLADVCQELLGLESVGRDDDIFELGADSLLVTQIAIRLRETLGADVPFASLFARSTIAEAADLIDTLRWARDGREPNASEEKWDVGDV